MCPFSKLSLCMAQGAFPHKVLAASIVLSVSAGLLRVLDLNPRALKNQIAPERESLFVAGQQILTANSNNKSHN